MILATSLPWPRRRKSLTHFTDGKGAGVPSIDLGSPAPREVKQLHEAGDHLILLLGMAQAAIATEAPGEHALLGVQDQLQGEKTWGLNGPTNNRGHLLCFCSREPGVSPHLPPTGGGDRSRCSYTRTFPVSSTKDFSILNFFLSHMSFPSPHQKQEGSVSREQADELNSLTQYSLNCRTREERRRASLPALDFSLLPHPWSQVTSIWPHRHFNNLKAIFFSSQRP